ncbi:hypothetical protein [Calycomorphotria hydatis]|uniref:Uncharacterized protein n=1 Tax=Calycomorphotria hydatis TaxID=2528027 RepID=A0A517T3U5_9PLAN|nr:hypothetical protein [Calycomorphotria hydatis]QDT63042.1 hypothetical protein V22_02410 [Calycomorphotria hydatis]
MKRFAALWKETWYAWCLFVALIVGLAITVTWMVLVMLFILPCMFFYFALQRFDKDGNQRGG